MSTQIEEYNDEIDDSHARKSTEETPVEVPLANRGVSHRNAATTGIPSTSRADLLVSKNVKQVMPTAHGAIEEPPRLKNATSESMHARTPNQPAKPTTRLAAAAAANSPAQPTTQKKRKQVTPPTPTAKLIGLKNLGRTCFINVLLQLLFSLKEVRMFFHQENDLSNNVLLQAIQKVFIEMESAARSAVVAPTDVIQALKAGFAGDFKVTINNTHIQQHIHKHIHATHLSRSVSR